MEVKKRMGAEGAINKLSDKKNIGEMEDSRKMNENAIWLGEAESEKKKMTVEEFGREKIRNDKREFGEIETASKGKTLFEGREESFVRRVRSSMA
jgi:tryptophanase